MSKDLTVADSRHVASTWLPCARKQDDVISCRFGSIHRTPLSRVDFCGCSFKTYYRVLTGEQDIGTRMLAMTTAAPSVSGIQQQESRPAMKI